MSVVRFDDPNFNHVMPTRADGTPVASAPRADLLAQAEAASARAWGATARAKAVDAENRAAEDAARVDGPDPAKMSVAELLAYGDVVLNRADETLRQVQAGRVVTAARARIDAISEHRADPSVRMARAREAQASAVQRRARGDADAVAVETTPSDALTPEMVTRALAIVEQCATGKLSRDGAMVVLTRSLPLSADEASSLLGDCGTEAGAGAVDAAGMATDDVVLDAMARARASGRSDDVLDNMARSSIVQAPPSAHADPQGLTAAQVAGVRAIAAKLKSGNLSQREAIDAIVRGYPLTNVEAAQVLEIHGYGAQARDAMTEVRSRADAARGRTAVNTDGMSPEEGMVARRVQAAADARARAMR